jgi:hypothetical protein
MNAFPNKMGDESGFGQTGSCRSANQDELYSRALAEIPQTVINSLMTGFLVRCRLFVQLEDAPLNAHWTDIHRLRHADDRERVPEEPDGAEEKRLQVNSDQIGMNGSRMRWKVSTTGFFQSISKSPPRQAH